MYMLAQTRSVSLPETIRADAFFATWPHVLAYRPRAFAHRHHPCAKEGSTVASWHRSFAFRHHLSAYRRHLLAH